MMHDFDCDVMVVGGGISGLTAAWKLHQSDIDVCLIESHSKVGGCARTDRRDGFLLEKGPFNIIVRHPTFETLLEEMSDDLNVVAADKSARKRFIYRGGKLHPVPTNPIALATTGLLRFGERLRLLRGLFYSRRCTSKEETIEQAATRRFGRAVSDAIVSAAISGIFAGDIKKLSLQACAPGIGRIDRKVNSLIGFGFASMFRSRIKKRAKKPRRWKGLVSIDGGLGALTGTIGNRLGSRLHTDTRVESIQPLDEGFEVLLQSSEQPAEKMTCRRLVLASSAQETSRLIKPLRKDASDILDTMESASLVVLNLGFRRADVGHDMQGFGFLVPHDEYDFPLMGTLWSDSIFPHHAPSDHRLIRVFMGGARDPQAATRSEKELVETAVKSLRPLLQIKGDPVLVDVCRYSSAIPQYHLGHVEKVSQLRKVIHEIPDLHLIGNYLDGVSINDCVRVATELSRELIQASLMNDLSMKDISSERQVRGVAAEVPGTVSD